MTEQVVGPEGSELRPGDVVYLFARDVSTEHGDYRVELVALQKPPNDRKAIVSDFNLFRAHIKPAKERLSYKRMLTVKEKGSEHLFREMVHEFEERHSEGKNQIFPSWQIEEYETNVQ